MYSTTSRFSRILAFIFGGLGLFITVVGIIPPIDDGIFFLIGLGMTITSLILFYFSEMLIRTADNNIMLKTLIEKIDRTNEELKKMSSSTD